MVTLTEPSKEIPCGYKIDSDTGAMLLIDMLYSQKKINDTTYKNIKRKYGKSNKER